MELFFFLIDICVFDICIYMLNLSDCFEPFPSLTSNRCSFFQFGANPHLNNLGGCHLV